MENWNEKKVYLEVIKENAIVSVTVRPGDTVEDVLIANGLPDYRLGFKSKGPFLMSSELLFPKVHREELLVCIMYAD